VRIFLIRHAHAIDEGARLGDEQRYLTDKGRQVARAVGRALRAQGVVVDAVLTSPLVRAVQTAELIAQALEHAGAVEVLSSLAPGVPSRVVAADLGTRAGAVALVGHEPNMSALGAMLVGRPGFPPFKKAQVMLVEDGRAVWSLDPETLAVNAIRTG